MAPRTMRTSVRELTTALQDLCKVSALPEKTSKLLECSLRTVQPNKLWYDRRHRAIQLYR